MTFASLATRSRLRLMEGAVALAREDRISAAARPPPRNRVAAPMSRPLDAASVKPFARELRAVLRTLMALSVVACGAPSTASYGTQQASSPRSAPEIGDVERPEGPSSHADPDPDARARALYARLNPPDREIASLRIAVEPTRDLLIFARRYATLANGLADHARAMASRLDPLARAGSPTWSVAADLRAGEIYEAAASALGEPLEISRFPVFVLTVDGGRELTPPAQLQAEARARLLAAAQRAAAPLECAAVRRYAAAVETARSASLSTPASVEAARRLARRSPEEIARCTE